MKKFALLLLSLALALGCLTLAAAESTQFTDATGSYTYILNSDGTAELVWYVAEPVEEHVTIPSVVDGYTVTAISGGAFASERCVGILTITIPDSVAIIESNPFYECTSLTAINVSAEHPVFTFQDGALINRVQHVLVAYARGLNTTSYSVPEGITAIGNDAFYKNNVLTSITLPEGFAFIEAEAFGWCSALNSINLPGTLAAIRTNGFAACPALTTLTIPDSVTTIEEFAFDCCDNLTIIGGAGSAAEKYCQANGIPFEPAK